MYKIKEIIKNTIIIDKSEFITTIYPVTSVSEVNEILQQTRKKYYDATHNCYAYILDNGNIQKASDDGEPSKTAGFPMLDVLKKLELTDILAITTRYFGGIKLGAGGLIRAYSSSVSQALKDQQLYTTKTLMIYEITIPYPDYSKNIDFWNKQIVKNSIFAADVILNIAFYEHEVEPTLEKIKNLTLGKALVKFINNESVDVAV